ncbi:uncharacterized protein VTP21DRAFT_4444 [Calcarisporiella thermophila]|uniref:uncharacterized protein n=1 Tax=Calcarisporiella thermophila TaxID=911321 RepID=UPI00374277DD
MVVATNLGFPRVGANRELKKLVESFWSSKITETDLLAGAKKLREAHWRLQQDNGIEHIPSNDFSFYDHVLDTAYVFGVVPQRYQHLPHGLTQYFAMGRGLQKPATETTPKVDVPACEMKKWFDTNYHFIVPEFTPDQQFHLATTKPVDEFLEAKELGIRTRPVLLGPISFLLLGKAAKGVEKFDTLSLLPRLLPAYEELLTKLASAGAEWVQIDEPVLIKDLPVDLTAFETVYSRLKTTTPQLKLLLTTYFGTIAPNLALIRNAPVDGIHIDLVRNPEQLDAVLAELKPTQVVSLGLVDGRNIWKTNLAQALATARRVVEAVGSERVFIAPSSSMLHSPVSTKYEVNVKKNNPEVFDWLAFAAEKTVEIKVLTKALNAGDTAVKDELADNARSIEARKNSSHTTNAAVRERVNAVTDDMYRRKSAFQHRRERQVAKLNLPLFPTTTIGSFPQTKEIRVTRSKFTKGEITAEEYEAFIKTQIQYAVKFQEEVGLDVLVHGESERDDMVAHFGKLLQGYLFTDNGWVVSYGSRCVKPPVIFGDVHRPFAMTVKETVYAQTLTQKPMKGMLTGPVTMLNWSFVRDDIPRKDVCQQIALAIRDEVQDLEKAGIPCIQVDEPAIREGLPLRRKDWGYYLDWSVRSFLLSTTGVEDSTQIHTHMCYSDFNDIFEAIQAMDADVITIENSKSDMKLLSAFEKYQYTNEIGPGVYDIHSPRVPSVEEMRDRVAEMLKYIPKHLLWINPDCGLKTRTWSEVQAQLSNMCEVARHFRAQRE